MTSHAWKTQLRGAVRRTDQAEGLRNLARGATGGRGPRYIAVTRVPWSDHETLTDDLGHALAALGRRVLIVTTPERGNVTTLHAGHQAGGRIEDIRDLPSPGCVARISACGAGPNGTGLRTYINGLRDRFDTVLVDLGTAPDDIDLLGLLPRDEIVFLAEEDPTVLFRTYALIKDLCVRRRVQTMHLLVANADDKAARGVHRTLSAVAASFLKVNLRFLGSLSHPQWNAWCPNGVDPSQARSRLLRDSDEMRRMAVRLLETADQDSIHWGGRGA
jgi:hypothetical protein